MWRDMSFVTRPFPKKPDWKIDNKDWFCEAVSDKWLMNKEDEEIYYYNIHEEE